MGLLILMLGLAFLLFLLRNPLASCLFVVSTTLLECLCWQSKHVQHYYPLLHIFTHLLKNCLSHHHHPLGNNLSLHKEGKKNTFIQQPERNLFSFLPIHLTYTSFYHPPFFLPLTPQPLCAVFVSLSVFAVTDGRLSILTDVLPLRMH